MKPLTAIIGVCLGIYLVSSGTLSNLHLNAASPLTPVAQAAPATTPPTTAAPPLAPTKASDGMYVRGVKMPANCHADQYPELVAYVTQHKDVPDSDIADYVCGWN